MGRIDTLNDAIDRIMAEMRRDIAGAQNALERGYTGEVKAFLAKYRRNDVIVRELFSKAIGKHEL